jgi:adenylate cyclase
LIVTGSSGLLDGERRPLTVMFSDLAGYSASTEHLPPEHVLEHLSRYFDALSKPIHRFHGTIDKFIGDSIMALWNAPVPDEDHVANACRAMLACRSAGEKLNRGFIEAGLPQMRTRFGLHTGAAIVGSVGPFTRLQYTALGAMVNLASRVEGMNKYFGTELLVTGAVEAAVRERFLLRPLGKVVAVGTEDAVEIFELVAELEQATAHQNALCAAWGAAFEPYDAQRWQEAAALFESFLSDYPADGAAPALVAHCLEELESEASADGALHFTTK